MSVLIISDVHGRPFWRRLLKTDLSSYSKVVFLGDYLDPYPDEGYSPDQAIEELKDIIAFKMRNLNKVRLLLGNHDVLYCGHSPYACRTNFKRLKEIHELFSEHRNLFQCAFYYENVLYTHAGVSQTWLDQHSLKLDPQQTCNYLNSLLTENPWVVPEVAFTGECVNAIKTPLLDVGQHRGGYYQSGSPIWADVNEVAANPAFKDSCIQIFGHTRLRNTGAIIQQDNWYMCDSREVFIYNNDLTVLPMEAPEDLV